METLLGKHWHAIDADDVAQYLESDQNTGLDRFAVRRRQSHFGPNLITASKKTSPLIVFVQQFNQALVYILIVAGMVTLFLQEYVEAAFIFGVVFINAIIGFMQESKAVAAIEALAQTMETTTTVIRSGRSARINASE